jgi:hypothetical protein
LRDSLWKIIGAAAAFLGFDKGLPVVDAEHLSEFVGILLDDLLDLEEKLGATVGRQCGPCGKRSRSCLDGSVNLLRGGLVHLRDDLPRGRVNDLDDTSASTILPLAANEMLRDIRKIRLIHWSSP